MKGRAKWVNTWLGKETIKKDLTFWFSRQKLCGGKIPIISWAKRMWDNKIIYYKRVNERKGMINSLESSFRFWFHQPGSGRFVVYQMKSRFLGLFLVQVFIYLFYDGLWFLMNYCWMTFDLWLTVLIAMCQVSEVDCWFALL